MLICLRPLFATGVWYRWHTLTYACKINIIYFYCHDVEMKSTVFVLYSYTKYEPIRNELFVVGVVTLTMYR